MAAALQPLVKRSGFVPPGKPSKEMALEQSDLVLACQRLQINLSFTKKNMLCALIEIYNSKDATWKEKTTSAAAWATIMQARVRGLLQWVQAGKSHSQTAEWMQTLQQRASEQGVQVSALQALAGEQKK